MTTMRKPGRPYSNIKGHFAWRVFLELVEARKAELGTYRAAYAAIANERATKWEYIRDMRMQAQRRERKFEESVDELLASRGGESN